MQKDISELDLPKNVSIRFPDGQVGAACGAGGCARHMRAAHGGQQCLALDRLFDMGLHAWIHACCISVRGRGTTMPASAWGQPAIRCSVLCLTHFPSCVPQDKIMNFEITLKPDEGLYK